MHVFALYTLYFFAYSFLGWIWEVIYFFAIERRFRNGGIVAAPLLPIYGFGALAILVSLHAHIENPFAIFVVSAALASVVEFAGHYFMEKIFHVRLWDYRNMRFNLQGRICLENSLGFGILALFLVYIVHPFLAHFVEMLPAWMAISVAFAALAIFALDIANSWRSMIKLRLANDATAETLRDIQQKLDHQLEQAKLGRKKIGQRVGKISMIGLRLHRANVNRLASNFNKIQMLSSRREKSRHKYGK